MTEAYIHFAHMAADLCIDRRPEQLGRKTLGKLLKTNKTKED